MFNDNITKVNYSCLTYKYNGCYYPHMFKKILLIFLLYLTLPCFSQGVGDSTNHKVFLYLYTENCGYCVKFAPIYDKLEQIYGKQCVFLKQDASTKQGVSLMKEFNAFYVPYVLLVNYEKQSIKRVAPTCLLNYACVKDAVDKFVN